MQKFRQISRRTYNNSEVSDLQQATNSAIGVLQSSLIAQGQLVEDVPIVVGLNSVRLPFTNYPKGAFIVRVDKEAAVSLAGYSNGIVILKTDVDCIVNLWVF